MAYFLSQQRQIKYYKYVYLYQMHLDIHIHKSPENDLNISSKH